MSWFDPGGLALNSDSPHLRSKSTFAEFTLAAVVLDSQPLCQLSL